MSVVPAFAVGLPWGEAAGAPPRRGQPMAQEGVHRKGGMLKNDLESAVSSLISLQRRNPQQFIAAERKREDAVKRMLSELIIR